MPEILKVSDQNQLVDTSRFNYLQFPFEKFNPIQSRLFEFYDQPANVVIAASTSAGKTCCAEIMLSHEVRKRGGRGMYIAPLKALSQEKIDDWSEKSHGFSDLNLSICTGDYRLTADRHKELSESDMVLMTSEMLGSSTRNYTSDKNAFLDSVGSLVTDECFTGSTRIKVDHNIEVTIKRIVEDNNIDTVISYDHCTNSVVKKKILRKIRRSRKCSLMRIKHEFGTITCTPNHKIWTINRGYVNAGDLTIDDKLKWIPVSNDLCCTICGKRFNKRGSLVSHYLYKHVCVGANAVHIDSIKKCNRCGKEFDSALSRSAHEMHHFRCADSYNKAVKTRENNPDYWRAMKEMGSCRTGKANPIFRNPESYRKFKRMGKERWESLSEEEKQEQIQRFINAPLMKTYDTSLELFVEDVIGDLEIRKTSNGRFWLNFKNGKRKNPDFKVNGQRKVIEVGDIEYWHSENEILETVENYRDIGYECLYLTNKDVENGKDHVRRKILDFLNNHTSKVLEISKWGRGGIEFVYDLEIEDCHNYFANGILVSNCHLITTPVRGDRLEVALMKMSRLNKNCRHIFLSATMPNVDDMANWLTRITDRDTYILESNYRPCPLEIHYTPYDDNLWKYEWKEKEKVATAMSLVHKYNKDKFLIFAHTKKTGELMKQALKTSGIDTEFHNADLGLASRRKLEYRFKNDPKFRVLVATSTLAWGINAPARRVIILGTNRGLTDVETYDINQMAGRAGRPRFDDRGDAYILLPKKRFGKEQIRLENPTPIRSQIVIPGSDDHHLLAFHIVSEIYQGYIKTIDDIYDWYNDTLAAYQNNNLELHIVEDMIEDLLKFHIVQETDGGLKTTSIGKIASLFYFCPFDVASLQSNFNKLFEYQKEEDTIWIASALAARSTFYKSGFMSTAEREQLGMFPNKLSDVGVTFGKMTDNVQKMTYCYYSMLYGYSNPVFNAIIRGLQTDVDRLIQVLMALDGMASKWGRTDYLKALSKRLRYGVDWDLLDLCDIPNIGRVKAKKLRQAGLNNADDILNRPKLTQAVLGCSDNMLQKIVSGIKQGS